MFQVIGLAKSAAPTPSLDDMMLVSAERWSALFTSPEGGAPAGRDHKTIARRGGDSATSQPEQPRVDAPLKILRLRILSIQAVITR